MALGIGTGKPLLGAASVLIEQIVQAGVQDVAYLDVVVAHDFSGLLVEEYGHTQLSAAIIRRVCQVDVTCVFGVENRIRILSIEGPARVVIRSQPTSPEVVCCGRDGDHAPWDVLERMDNQRTVAPAAGVVDVEVVPIWLRREGRAGRYPVLEIRGPALEGPGLRRGQ